MPEAYDPRKLFETLYTQIENATEYDEAHKSANNNAQIISRTLLLIWNTGMYTDSCIDWRRNI